jgi:hypothetical protein
LGIIDGRSRSVDYNSYSFKRESVMKNKYVAIYINFAIIIIALGMVNTFLLIMGVG